MNIDALDENAYLTGDFTITDLVAQAETLPSSARSLVTGRPEIELLRSLRRRSA